MKAHRFVYLFLRKGWHSNEFEQRDGSTSYGTEQTKDSPRAAIYCAKENRSDEWDSTSNTP